jgi:hypothetical protein
LTNTDRYYKEYENSIENSRLGVFIEFEFTLVIEVSLQVDISSGDGGGYECGTDGVA